RRRARSLEIRYVVARRRPPGRLFLLPSPAKVQEADETLVVRQPDRGPSLGCPQDAGRAPVADEPARVRREQDDVAGAAGRERLRAESLVRAAGADGALEVHVVQVAPVGQAVISCTRRILGRAIFSGSGSSAGAGLPSRW